MAERQLCRPGEQEGVAVLGCMLLFVLYVLATDMVFVWLIHIIELVLIGLLLWRVETLPQLDSISTEEAFGPSVPENTAMQEAEGSNLSPLISAINLAQIERLLAERCVDTQLYLQHDLTVQQLAQAIGTNRLYLNQYFSRQGITYNTYINNLRINHFINRYQEVIAAGQSVVAQQLARESGYRSYSTFSLAFKQRTGQSVTAWIRESAE